ncbi:MAG TPA: hypothetical protein VMU22_09305, partial [Rhizomicrobium sp.]|nr:hypothetical protein [Rhizomicrobium sp.]
MATQAAKADDALLKDLSAKLVAMRGTHPATNEYGAGPELIPIKHQIRLWIESELPKLGEHGDVDRLAKDLNQKLSSAGLMCGDPSAQKCTSGDNFEPRGFVDDVHLSYLNSRYLLVRTNVGVLCGYDESAYVYAWRENRWALFFETEQNDYRKGHYTPQNLFSVSISPGKANHLPLVLTLGYSPWCQSAWQKLFARLWRVSKVNSSLPPIFDLTDVVYLNDDGPQERLSDHDALFAFESSSIDGDVFTRTHVWRLAANDHSVRRLEPVALSPRDFVDEWLTRPWNEGVGWIEPSQNGSQLRDWYVRYHRGVEIIFGEFDGPPLRCRSDKTLWQVGFTQQGGPKNPDLSAYFLVRWLAPYRFTLVDIRTSKSRDCDVKDPMRDNV